MEDFGELTTMVVYGRGMQQHLQSPFRRPDLLRLYPILFHIIEEIMHTCWTSLSWFRMEDIIEFTAVVASSECVLEAFESFPRRPDLLRTHSVLLHFVEEIMHTCWTSLS